MLRFIFFVSLLLIADLSATPQTPLAISANQLPIPHPLHARIVREDYPRGTYSFPENVVLVPGGRFVTGIGNKSKEVQLEPFCMGRFEVTNAEYAVFLAQNPSFTPPRYWRKGLPPKGKENHPVLWVSYDEAQAYCAWVSKNSPFETFIPTAPQWEKAARDLSGGRYPWGETHLSSYEDGKLTTRYNYNAYVLNHILQTDGNLKTQFINATEDEPMDILISDIKDVKGQPLRIHSNGTVTAWIDKDYPRTFVNTVYFSRLANTGGFTTPVGFFENGKSPYGCYDVSGNAYEWTSTAHLRNDTKYYEIRGGGWSSSYNYSTVLDQNQARLASFQTHSLGFRIAVKPKFTPVKKEP